MGSWSGWASGCYPSFFNMFSFSLFCFVVVVYVCEVGLPLAGYRIYSNKRLTWSGKVNKHRTRDTNIKLSAASLIRVNTVVISRLSFLFLYKGAPSVPLLWANWIGSGCEVVGVIGRVISLAGPDLFPSYLLACCSSVVKRNGFLFFWVLERVSLKCRFNIATFLALYYYIEMQ